MSFKLVLSFLIQLNSACKPRAIQQCRQCQSKLIVFNSDQLPIRLPLDETERFQPHEEQSSLHFAGCAPPKPQLYNLMSEGLFVPLSMSCPLFLSLTLSSLHLYIFINFTLLDSAFFLSQYTFVFAFSSTPLYLSVLFTIDYML